MDTKEKLKILKKVGIPEFVKNADTPNSPSSFAGVNDFPTHTKAATWLSCNAFELSKNEYAEEEQAFIAERLEKAANEWNIDYQSIKENLKEAQKEPEKKYAFETKHNGKVLKLCPISNWQSIKQASAWLFTNKNKLPYEWRTKIAEALLKEAEEYNKELPGSNYLYKAAGYGYADPDKVSKMLCVRAKYVEDTEPEASKLLNKLAMDVLEENMNFEVRAKYAELMAEIDEKFGLNKRYDKDFLTPEEICYGFDHKQAAEVFDKHIKLANGAVINIEELEACVKEAAKALGKTGEKLLDSVKEAANLNKEDADTLLLFVNPDFNYDFINQNE